MTDITLEDVKNYLGVIHNATDDKLRMLLAGAIDEACQFLDVPDLDCLLAPCGSWSSADPVSESNNTGLPATVKIAVMVLVQAGYEGSPADQEQLRKVAETKLMPYRRNLGI